MISVAVASATQFSKSYSHRCFACLNQLREEIAGSGRHFVHLVSVDRWDGSWETYASNIPVMSLDESHLAWLAAPAADSRYLVCGL